MTTSTIGDRLDFMLSPRVERTIHPAILYRPYTGSAHPSSTWSGYGDLVTGALRIGNDGSVIWHELATIAEHVFSSTLTNYVRYPLESMPGKVQTYIVHEIDGFVVTQVWWAE